MTKRWACLPLGLAALLAAAPAAAFPIWMGRPDVRHQMELRQLLDLRGLVERLGEPIERIELVEAQHWRVSGARCHVDVRMVRVPSPLEGLRGPRYGSEAGERVCSR